MSVYRDHSDDSHNTWCTLISKTRVHDAIIQREQLLYINRILLLEEYDR